MAEGHTIETYGRAPHNRLRNAWPILLFALVSPVISLLTVYAFLGFYNRNGIICGFAPPSLPLNQRRIVGLRVKHDVLPKCIVFKVEGSQKRSRTKIRNRKNTCAICIVDSLA